MNSTNGSVPPKVFISYSWTTPEHQEWVLHFASALRDNGVEAILDKWHLSEGQDTLAFMESMVSDPSVSKVLLISDARYAERANSRVGGVGIEAQIVSPKIYEGSDQTKFAAVVTELDVEGRPILPHYMTSRLYFDMSSEDAHADNFLGIVRWIFGKPFHAVPPVGKPPSFLEQTHSIEANVILEGRRLRQSRHAPGEKVAGAAAVLDAVIESVDSMALSLAKEQDQDTRVWDGIVATRPVSEEAYRALRELVRQKGGRTADLVHSFFERIFGLWDRSPLEGAYTRWDNDVVRFFGHDAFISFVAICLQERDFQLAAEVLAMPFFKPRRLDRTGDVKNYSDFHAYLESLEGRNTRLKLNRYSLHADALRDHHDQSIVNFDAFLEADMLLFLRGVLNPDFGWHPITFIYLADSSGALPTFARATSQQFYDRLRALLFHVDSDKLKEAIIRAPAENNFLTRGFRGVAVPELFNAERLATLG